MDARNGSGLIALLSVSLMLSGCFSIDLASSDESSEDTDESLKERPSQWVDSSDIEMDTVGPFSISQTLGLGIWSINSAVSVGNNGRGLTVNTGGDLIDLENGGAVDSELWVGPLDITGKSFEGWSRVVTDTPISAYSVDTDEKGNFIIAWATLDSPWYVTYTANKGLSEPRSIEGEVRPSSEVSVSMNAEGDALISWTNGGAMDERRLMSVHYDRGVDQVSDVTELTLSEEGDHYHAGGFTPFAPGLENSISIGRYLMPTPRMRIELMDDGRGYALGIANQNNQTRLFSRLFDGNEWGDIDSIEREGARAMRISRNNDEMDAILLDWDYSAFHGSMSYPWDLEADFEEKRIFEHEQMLESGGYIHDVSFVRTEQGSKTVSYFVGGLSLSDRVHHVAREDDTGSWSVKQGVITDKHHPFSVNSEKYGIVSVFPEDCEESLSGSRLQLTHHSGDVFTQCVNPPLYLASIGVNEFGEGVVIGADGFDEDGFEGIDPAQHLNALFFDLNGDR